MEQIEILNRALFLNINAAPNSPPWCINSAMLLANDLIYLIPALLIAMWLWGDNMKRNLALKACLVTLLALGLNQIIGLAWQHPRPFMTGLGHAWLPHVADSSFPSDHVTVFGAIGLSLLLGGAMRLGLWTLVAGLTVAWSRVFLGVHFPLDMLGAIGVACFSYALVVPVWRYAGNHVTGLLEQFYRSVMARPIAWGLVRQ